jgi:hypothetical protein
MAQIIPFITRDAYEAKKFEEPVERPALTDYELYQMLVEASFEDMNDLIRKLKSSGRWNQQADVLMRRVMTNVDNVCAAIAGVKEYGKTKEIGPDGVAINLGQPVGGQPGTTRPVVKFLRDE